MIKGLTEKQNISLIIGDISSQSLSIENACEVMGCLIDSLEQGMKEHSHFEGYIEEHIHRAKWVMSKIFEDASEIRKAAKETEGLS